MIATITPDKKQNYNALVSHPLQSFEWGEFRIKTGLKVIRKGFFQENRLLNAFQMTIHPLPLSPFKIGYLPKGALPTPELLIELQKVGKQEKCIFIQLEPNVIQNPQRQIKSRDLTKGVNFNLVEASHPLFTKYTFILDLTKSEEELLQNMHPKTRYNIRVAQKHKVVVLEDNSGKSFNEYLNLTRETTTRQNFFAHSESYHKIQWQTLKHTPSANELSSHLLTAVYQGKVLVAWILFVFKDTLYYPYGASSNQNRNTMASSLMMWEAILFGKRMGLKKFDMWGAASEKNPSPSNPYYGFHRFKMGYGPKYTEFIGSFDLVLNPFLYQAFKISDKARWLFLKHKK